MRTTPLDPARTLGVTVTDVDLRTVTPEQTEELKDLLAEHGVAVFPTQELDDDAFVTFLRGFGDLAFTQGETPVEGQPDLNVISNVGRTTPPRSTFHVDSSYLRVPPAYTALRTVLVPQQGGETLFTDQYAALETLPDDLRERVEGRSITHVVTGLDDLDDDAETEAVHPVVRPHPRSGRPVLFLSTPARCAAVSGLDDDEAAATVQALFEHSTREDNIVRHAWAPGDVVMWDNSCVLHRADHSDVHGDRVMHRGMVAGSALRQTAAGSGWSA